MNGILQQPVGVRLLGQRLGVAHESGQQAYDGLDDRERGDLAAVEHVVADGDLAHLQPRGSVVHHPLVDALVATAREDQVLPGGQVGGDRLGERRAGRCGYDEDAPVRRDAVQRLAPGLGLHHHAGTPAVGGVVDRAVAVVGPRAQVVDVHVEQAALLRLAGQGQPERCEVVGKDRDDVDAHHRGRPGSRGWSSMTIRRAGEVDLGHEHGHEREEHLAVRRTDRQQVLGSTVLHARELADHLTVGGLARSPTSWWS